MKERKLLRKAAYWLADYARAFRGDEPGVKRFHDQIMKLAKQCRTAGREPQHGAGEQK